MRIIKQIKKIMPVLFLALSWLILLNLTSENKPWYIFSTKENSAIASVSLGDIAVENYDRMGFTKGLVEYVKSNNTWLVGTDKGEILSINQSGEILWKRALGTAKLTSLAVNNEGTIAFIGEQSSMGYIYAVDIISGEIVWKYASSEVIGSKSEQRSLPGIMHINVDEEKNVYLIAYRFLMNADSSREYFARIVALNQQGQVKWKYPAQEVMDSWANWSALGGKEQIVVSTSAYELRDEMKYQDSLYFFSQNTGELLVSQKIKPIEPFSNTVMRSSPNFNANGTLLAASTSDGRGLLLNDRGEILWERNLSKPQLIDGAWINASARDAYITDAGIIFTTINTFNRANWQLPTPVEHPGDNSIFCFDVKGDLKYKVRFSGMVEQLAINKMVIACAIGRNVRTHNYGVHGVAVLDPKTGEKTHFFKSAGPTQAVAISQDGKTIAAIEAGALTPDGKTIGAYRLNIYTVSK